MKLKVTVEINLPGEWSDYQSKKTELLKEWTYVMDPAIHAAVMKQNEPITAGPMIWNAPVKVEVVEGSPLTKPPLWTERCPTCHHRHPIGEDGTIRQCDYANSGLDIGCGCLDSRILQSRLETRR